MHFESSILIVSPIEKVYQIAETYPTFVESYCIKSIVENSENKIVVNIGYRLFGFIISWTGLGEKTRYRSIKYVQTNGILKGMEASWNFIDLIDKTEVIIGIEIKKPIWFLNYFIKKIVKRIVNNILIDLKNTVEKEEFKCIL